MARVWVVTYFHDAGRVLGVFAEGAAMHDVALGGGKLWAERTLGLPRGGWETLHRAALSARPGDHNLLRRGSAYLRDELWEVES